MYGSFNSNYDRDAVVEVPADFRWKFDKEKGVWTPREDTHIEIHECGYVEGDTGGAVENDNDSGWTWGTIEEGFDRGYESVTEREQWLLNPHDARVGVYYLNSENGRAAREAQRDKKVFDYDGNEWRVYRLHGAVKYPEKDYSRSTETETVYRYFTQIGRNDDWSCFAILLDYGTEVLWEWLSDLQYHGNLKWSDCDCQSSRYADY
ncbi:MAG TPA: hypothetical protein VIL74_08790 [Pyrinomonadaceae bacterium]|jgi:hypothetical protein